MGKIIGIDLGTTNSLVAYVDEGRPVVIRDDSGDALVPSAFSITLVLPFSMMATQEFVVPRSMPMIFPMMFPFSWMLKH